MIVFLCYWFRSFSSSSLYDKKIDELQQQNHHLFREAQQIQYRYEQLIIEHQKIKDQILTDQPLQRLEQETKRRTQAETRVKELEMVLFKQLPPNGQGRVIDKKWLWWF